MKCIKNCKQNNFENGDCMPTKTVKLIGIVLLSLLLMMSCESPAPVATGSNEGVSDIIMRGTDSGLSTAEDYNNREKDHLSAGKYDEAFIDFTTALTSDMENAETYNNRGGCIPGPAKIAGGH
jgi:hypothetical protein